MKGVTLVRAPNPSPMTLSGTNTYIVDCFDRLAMVVDPGPNMDSHVETLQRTAADRDLRIVAIVISHGHPDHAPASLPLAFATGATVYAHPQCATPHARDLELGGELRVGERTFSVMDAPGHTFDHVVLYEPHERLLFTGDTIVGEGTVVVAPPGGGMRPYQETLERLAREFPEARTILGGHGPQVDDAQAKIAEYIAHRKERERQLVATLALGPRTLPELVTRIYADTRRELWPAAARQLLAYLEALVNEGRVTVSDANRPMASDEYAMLNPRWESLVDPALAGVIEAELGAAYRIETLERYALRGGASEAS